jgi:hypothetical protein
MGNGQVLVLPFLAAFALGMVLSAVTSRMAYRAGYEAAVKSWQRAEADRMKSLMQSVGSPRAQDMCMLMDWLRTAFPQFTFLIAPRPKPAPSDLQPAAK